MTIQIAEIIVNIFKKLYDINLEIKTPNDIVFNGKKLGGILTETKSVGETVKYIVIGIGVNTNQVNFSKKIADIASSVKKEFNIDVDNNDVIAEFCNLFEKVLI